MDMSFEITVRHAKQYIDICHRITHHAFCHVAHYCVLIVISRYPLLTRHASTPSLSLSWQRPADLILGHRIQVTKKVECQPERKRRTRMQWDWQRRRDQRGRPQRQQQQRPPPKRGRRPTVR